MGQHRSIGRLISILHRASQMYFQRESLPLGLPHGQFHALHFIAQNEGLPQSQIQTHFELDKGSVSSLMKGLEKNGFIERRPDELDKRSAKIYLTAKARKQLPAINKVFKQWTCQLLAGFSDEEKETLFDYMERMMANVKA
jgi:MarR family transcriptional regulator, transcriptional regulator for hemolysin